MRAAMEDHPKESRCASAEHGKRLKEKVLTGQRGTCRDRPLDCEGGRPFAGCSLASSGVRGPMEKAR
jgi:hypothetical protein